LTTMATTDSSTPTGSDTGTETVEESTETEPRTETEPGTETETGPGTQTAEAAAVASPTETAEATDEGSDAAKSATGAGAAAGTGTGRSAATPSQGGSGSAPARPAKPICQTTGRRKRAVARVRLRPGNGKITINRREFEAYFTSATHRMIVAEPLRISSIADRYDIDATIDGGGVSGQAGALRLGITRALIIIDPELRTNLKRAGLLTRDAREKESKKYGLKKARKAPQYSKR